MKSNPRIPSILIVLGLTFNLFTPQTKAWTGPTWFEPRLALANETEAPTFLVPEVLKRETKQAPKPDTVRLFTGLDVTSYTSSVEECDGDPFTTADGSVVADGIIAANFLPFNTSVRIPALFGEKIFEVHDRMNTRYPYRVDVWMKDKAPMRQFGLKRNVTIEVVEWGDGKTQWNKKKIAS